VASNADRVEAAALQDSISLMPSLDISLRSKRPYQQPTEFWEGEMHHRGNQYWAWADCQLHSRSHDEELSDGTQIDVQVRVSRDDVTQVFIGVYGSTGSMLFEEYHDSLLSEATSCALVWGVDRARALATGAIVGEQAQRASS
jgi:hypothetical protein